MAQEQTVLPKGIVLNNETIYAEIAKYDIIPVDMILKSCRVYSTTSRKLYDPTARRLENFWTRLLGGDRRYLSGRLISQLFRDISEETAFVKLRGPDNRYEPPSPSSRPHDAQATSSASASKLKLKSTTPSSKTPRPILKRPRGTSASGPRPTARFVSPPEPGITGELTTVKATKDSGSSASKEEKVKGRPIKPKKKATAFVASTSRRRPGMPRRTSSQSSAGASDLGPKEGDSSLGSKYDGSQSSIPTILEKPEQQLANTNKGKGTVGVSAKAAGKRPMTQPQVDKTELEPEKVGSSQSQNATLSAEQSSDRPGRAGNAAGSFGSRSKTSSPAAVLKTNTPQETSPLMIRSSSDAGPIRPTSRDTSRATVPPTSLMSSTPAKLDTSVIGQGTISGFREDLRAQSALLDRPGDSSVHGTPDLTSEIPSGSGLSRPTQPSTTAAIPLARSKSQLSLLLDRNGEKPKSKR
ncbi:hypothetical protein F5B22DRAFT_463224 [Xylaria bambusicola]|uniref:uncharacterized protein n=1 Tax=Xylaria bambusicola TaxID=326684 RepID=UPI0020089761|nr:uncharacterized protein F5B22DRAFT_463224 [Xylaria bambusicola]KAI0522187.1 hypothetical protein F5B22DRAFT_463224 [Xylaria bambusicola]